MLSHLLVCIPLFFPVQGDRAETKTGEVLQGKVVTMSDGKLEFASDSVGTVTIPFDSLESLITDREIQVLLEDGSLRKYRFTGANDTIDFGSIQGLNPKVPDPLSGAVSLGLSRSRGNTDRLSFSLQANATYDWEHSRLASSFTWIYGQDQDPSTGNSFVSQRRVSWDNQYDYYVTDRLYAYGRFTALGDKESQIDYRYTLGAGLGYSVIKTGKHEVNGELGGSERWEAKTNLPSDSTFNIRLASNGSHKVLDDSKLTWDIEYLPSVEDSNVYLINFNIGIAFKIWGDLVSTMTYGVNYDNTPAPGKKRTDQRFIWGLGVTF